VREGRRGVGERERDCWSVRQRYVCIGGEGEW